MGTGFSKKKKQAKMFQDTIAKMQEDMKNTEVTGQAGNGLVVVTVNGEHQLTNITIKPECVDPEDVEGLEDLIKAALDDASSKISDNMPSLDSLGGMGMPFH
ncbi:MAG: YbaB/EbfC family nucleoid-associated protein [Waddliaceae bacterium]|jgi:nucleoid-associated protein EbfC|nr:YbaB/EbfC family nucleoid-associated protein [Waddliaceae bacterium]MBT3578713.1 YbaB/EbfC family nucleoid-associated protein [Waddliaceae bacterium]MBT4444385.1 YbaB/EbfC family nucleoid-associated protein [Waddliaceae bacterium]MBT6928300.1 YbaB/EbfC family nucleoid-associated protein [Waddliaceae bacterium]MBT7264986.1 YbaB/EbfC family nucleoid-associated protein [Waddliaceae bacterium]